MVDGSLVSQETAKTKHKNKIGGERNLRPALLQMHNGSIASDLPVASQKSNDQCHCVSRSLHGTGYGERVHHWVRLVVLPNFVLL